MLRKNSLESFAHFSDFQLSSRLSHLSVRRIGWIVAGVPYVLDDFTAHSTKRSHLVPRLI